MPLYTVAISEPLSMEARTEVANLMTDIHCGLTGAPSEFMNVIFMTGHHLKKGVSVGINGNVRGDGNRGAELIAALRDKMNTSVADVLGLAKEEVSVNLLSVKSKWVMEGSMILPEPGEEEGWLEAKNAAQEVKNET